MSRQRRWTAITRTAALFLVTAGCVSAARLYGQARPATKPAAPQAAAQHLTAGPSYTSSGNSGGDGKVSPKFPRVDVVFTLVGADGKPIQATPADLQLFSQNKQIATATSLRRFDQTGYGVTSILAIDASGSMRGAPLNAIHASIAKFVGQARAQDRVGVVTFADDTRMDVPFNHTQAQMTAELQTVKARGTSTHLWDGLLYALDQYLPDSPARRMLVVISDGHDEGSQSHLEDVIRKARERNVTVSAIGLTRDRGQYLHFLQDLAAATGGSFRRAMSAADLEGMIQDGLAAQHATPVATFDVSRLNADGRRQNVELHWLPGRLSATTSILTISGGSGKPPIVDRLWLWGLGACFVAGIILLAVSWRSSRRKPMPVDPYPAAAANFNANAAIPPPVPSAMPYSPAVAPAQPYERPIPLTPRSPTIDESDFVASDFPASNLPPRLAPKQYIPTETPRIETLQDAAASRAKQRSMTQLAGVFEAPPEGPYAWLQIKSGELAGTGVPVTATEFSLGALPGNHLTLPGDATISGRHARLTWEGGILKLEDTQSTNGTYLNGLKLESGRHIVRPGDEIRLGKAVLEATAA